MKGEGCTVRGVCTKDAQIAGLQDHLVWGLQSLATCAVRATVPILPADVNVFVTKALFSTLTNVNFLPEDHVLLIRQCEAMRDRIIAECHPNLEGAPAVVNWKPGKDIAELVEQARAHLIPKRFAKLGKDRVCLQELLVYGLKGLCAYLYHAMELGKSSDEISNFVLKALAFINKEDPSVGELFDMCMECGRQNLATMKLLDEANTSTYGHPEPTKVHWAKSPASAISGKAILVSGHDLLELEEVLKQTEGKGINVWTHGEMLPCIAYPGLKKYKHLVGHYGTAWQNQRREFEAFPGPIYMTTNCYIPAPPSYLGRVFCCTPVGGVGVSHVSRRDLSALITAALNAPGFGQPTEEPAYLTIGFARNTVLSVADKVIDAVKSKQLRHIFLVGGCDGFSKDRNYYTEFAEKVPNDCLILTLACGKFKVNMHDYGTLGSTGLPRLLDVGQCNDSYSAIVVAVELAKAFNTDVNSLPLTLVLSWFEQKAVAILLTLLSLGIKNIYVGPSIPAFFTPTVLNVLVEKFNIHPIGKADEDLKAILG